MLTELLKEHTKKPHQELEGIIIQRIKQIDSEAAYSRFLKIFYGYIAAVEQQLNAVINTGVIADYVERRKAENILNDISELESSDESLSLATNLPQIASTEQALGAMYVLEGSTLGGKYISRMIADKLNLEEGKGLSFFNGYREDTGMMWERFKETLNNYPLNSSSEHIVVDAANQTFIKFKEWINER